MRSSLTLIGFSVPTDVNLTLVLIKSQSGANLGTIKTEVEVNLSVLSSSRNNWLTRSLELRTFDRKLQDKVHTFFRRCETKCVAPGLALINVIN